MKFFRGVLTALTLSLALLALVLLALWEGLM